MKKTVIILLLSLVTNFCFSQDSTNTVTINSQTIQKIQEDIQEIRRDQLNYKIEKDLLKETYGSLKDTYASNYTTVQIIISLILGLFAILGYLGLKGIINLKKEYDSELVKIKDLKTTFETNLKELKESQEKVKGQIESIDTINEVQSKKIKILEIKEKVGSWVNQNGYQRALDYIAIGLELAQDDFELLLLRAYSLFKLRRYAESIEAHKKVLLVDADNQSIIQNLSELYLIVGQIDNYTNLTKEKLEFIKMHSEGLFQYFEAFKFFLQNNTAELKKTILEFIDKQDLSISKNYIANWNFLDLYDFLKSKPEKPEKTLLINFTNYLKGGMTGLQMKEQLK